MTELWIVQYAEALQLGFLFVAGVAVLASLDDVFVDICYWVQRSRHRNDVADLLPDTAEKLAAQPEKAIAIMVPAWHESDVIYSMLASNLRLLRYSKVHYFVGAYENDPATLHEVERAQKLSTRIHFVIVPHPGPTNKADCLNEILASAVAREPKLGVTFSGFVLHDAEDLIHPLELQVFNAALDQFDFIQLPVFSFTRRLRDWVGASYMDEFAENHVKDMTVRTQISGFIPCAGVAACFGRRAIEALANAQEGQVFKAGALTEDYDVAHRLSELGMRPAFLPWEAPYYMDTPHGHGAPKLIRDPMPVSTREHFPSNFVAAYRQRARWILGISLVGARELGWHGSAGTRLFLWRDRKGLLTIPAVMFGYALFIANLALFITALLRPDMFPPGLFMPDSGPARVLIVASLVLALWRAGHRYFFTARLYGTEHGLLAVPRMLVSNLLNFLAVCRAVRLYIVHRVTGRALTWDKTAHTYPDHLPSQLPSMLRPYHMSVQGTSADAADKMLDAVMAQQMAKARAKGGDPPA